ncbi:MAG: PD40 domain-containing protein [Cyclobacteriaceae bacterium]
MRFKTFVTFLTLLVAQNIHAQDSLRTLADTIRYYKSTAAPIDALNSDKIDYAPSISADGRTMIIESNKEGRYLLYESRFANNSWSEPTPLEAINNFGDTTDLIGGPSLSFDGNLLFFFASFRSGLGSEDIYYSERVGNEWSEPRNIGAPINSVGYEGFPSISADGNTLFFVRQNLRGPSDEELQEIWENKACYSIYTSEKDPKTGEWSNPEKAPYPINLDCEKAPRIMADNRTLIFASNRTGGLGDYDLYQTQLNDIGDWVPPTALEFINTDKADQFASISAQGDILYFVYDIKDIYSVQIPPHLQQFKNNIIQGFITDGISGNGIGAQITVSDAFTSREMMKISNNPNDGRYTVVLPVGSNYNVEVKKEGFTSQSFFYDLSEETSYQEIEQDITLYSSAELNVNIYDIDIFEPIVAKITVKDQTNGNTIMEEESDPSGKVTLNLPLGSSYAFTIEKEHFISEEFTFDVSGLVVYRNFAKDVELMPVKRNVDINITDLTNDGRIRSRVRIRNRNRDEVLTVEGNESVALRVGDRYEIEATSDQGYAFNSTVIDVNPEGEEITVVSSDGSPDSSGPGLLGRGIKLQLQPLLVGSDLTLKDILFASNSDVLDEISYVELARVVDLMLENPTLKVEIAAHTDDVGSAAYNQALSERRAQSVVKLMIENDVAQDRFVAKGLGEAQPVVPNDTEENKAKNRRVVLKILSI